MTELLGPFPRRIYHGNKYSKQFFRRKGELRNIRNLEYWPLKDVLVEKYKMEEMEAESLSSFLLPMLSLDPSKRATAAQCLEHDWLRRRTPSPSINANT